MVITPLVISGIYRQGGACGFICTQSMHLNILYAKALSYILYIIFLYLLSSSVCTHPVHDIV